MSLVYAVRAKWAARQFDGPGVGRTCLRTTSRQLVT